MNNYQNLLSVDWRLKDLRAQLKITQDDRQAEKLREEIEILVKEQTKLVNQIVKARRSK